ncbi:MAG TPA: hypothetical protein VLM89_01440 [Phycisphaerae bacterium]|nr:hypothetical protein [Phycisphaerae bacterium]
MKRRSGMLCLTVAVVGAIQANSLAGVWCEGIIAGHPQTILCDDFDRYCVDPPPWPERCVVHSTPDQQAFLLNWPEVSANGNEMKVKDEYKTAYPNEPLYADSWPFTVRYRSGDDQYLDTQHNRDLRPAIAAIDPTKNTVNGTDANPLILDFVFHFHDEGRQYYQSAYLDISLHDGVALDRAPTDYVMSEDCSQSYSCGDSRGYPIICQQNNPMTVAWGCPSALSLPPHASIAVGVLAWLDTNPCHCGEDVAHAAQNWHLVFFDGQRWWTLKSNVPAPSSGTRTPRGSSPEPPPTACKIKSPGDFGLFNGLNRVRLTIKTSTVVVDHWYRQMCETNNTWKYDITHTMTIPRQYLGGFNNIAMGCAKGCKLNANGQCLGPRHPLGPNGHGGSGEIDSVALVDGVLGSYAADGACCKPDLSCVETDPVNCGILGGYFAGAGKTCATTVCCPIPFADSDLDRDVDQADFGAFQVCHSGTNRGIPAGCECYNRNGDNGIDPTDFAEFNNCWTGPQVQWSQALTPNCAP